MPLPPLPPNNTARVWFKYVTGVQGTSQTHEVMWRFNQNSAGYPEVEAGFLAVLNAFGAAQFRNGWRVLSARLAADGAVFSLPVQPSAPLLAFVGTMNANEYNGSWEAVEDSFQGRSFTSGRKVDFSLYRAAGPIDSTFRYGMPGPLQTALSTASGNEALVTIDKTPPSWYTYVNQNYNSYWERQLRS